MKKIIIPFFKPNASFCAIEHTSKNNEVSITYASLIKKNNEVRVENISSYTSVQDFVKSYDNKHYVTLCINDDHVLTKRIESTISNPLKLVQKTFSNINIDEFFFEITSFKTVHFISICRKTYLFEIIKLYKSNSINVKNIALGLGPVLNVARFIDAKKINTSNYEIEVIDNIPVGIIKNQSVKIESYNVNGIVVESHSLSAFSSAMLNLLNNLNIETNFVGLQDSLIEHYQHHRFFTFFTKFALCFLLGILAINFVFFNHYFNRANEFRLTAEATSLNKEKLQNYKQRLDNTYLKVDGLLNTIPSKSSYFIDAISSKLPEIISLSEMQFQPLVKKIKEKNEVHVKNDILILSGESSDKESFSQWIYSLESMEWVISVHIINYEDIVGTISNFTIKLNCRYDL